MCGRYALHDSPEVVALQFWLDSVPRFVPRYNIAPAATALIVQPRGAALARWGLRGGRHNARAETIAVKRSFRSAYRSRRCLVPASGFYEWKRSGSLSQPYYIHPGNHPLFALAGLWEDGSFAVITTEASRDMSAIHDRMPAIIAPEHYADWLDGADGLLRPAPEGAIRCHPVSAAVNRAANESPELIAAIGSEVQRGLFD